MKNPKIEVRPRLRVMLGRDIALGPGKAELLEWLDRTGSITRAAREMNMSYMRAWTLIRTMNRCFKTPLVASTHGGARGGGATLTDTGRQILALYQKMDAECLRSMQPNLRKLEELIGD